MSLLVLRLSQIGKMASATALQKLETRAVAAEKLIALLRLQIKEAKEQQCVGGSGGVDSAELDSLKSENSNLKGQIQSWKNKLTQAEIANGKTVFCADKSNTLPETNKVDTPAGQPQKVDKPPNKEGKDKPKKEKKEAVKKEVVPEGPVDVGRLDMRVGHIRSAKKHPDADALYVEEVDVGEEKPRTVISGLVKFIPEPDMQDRMAVILCNLKPSKMRGIMSEAMVMCASTPDKVEILTPPAGSKPGDPVLVQGYQRNPDTQLNPKKKIFEACAPDLAVNTLNEACYKGVRWTVNGEPVKSQTLVNVQVK